MIYKALLAPKSPHFHIYNKKIQPFIAELKKELSQNGFVGMIDLEGITNKKLLFQTFVDVFKFPEYFGYNWDAFDECMNDLAWLKVNLYTIILKNIDKTQLDQYNKHTLLELLNRIALEWAKGRNFNTSFTTPPTPFHIIIISDEDKTNEIIGLLKKEDILDFDVLK